MSKLSLADHATIANMSPEYGATMGFFPVDHVTLQYLKLARISDDTVSMIEAYLQANKMFVDYNEPQIERVYSSYLELNLVLQPWVSGPKSPHDRVVLSEMKTDWHACLDSKVGFNETYLAGTTFSTFLNEIQPLGAEDNCQRSEGLIPLMLKILRRGWLHFVASESSRISSARCYRYILCLCKISTK